MPLRVPKFLVIVTRPVFKDGEAVMNKEKQVVERIKALPGKAFKFLQSEIEEITATHGESALKRAIGVIPDDEPSPALPAGPAVDADEGDGKLPGDDDL